MSQTMMKRYRIKAISPRTGNEIEYDYAAESCHSYQKFGRYTRVVMAVPAVVVLIMTGSMNSRVGPAVMMNLILGTGPERRVEGRFIVRRPF